MPELNASIPLQTRVPSMADAFAPLSAILDIQGKKQNIESGRIANTENQARLSERTALRNLANDPRVQDEKGNVDPAKFATLAPQVAPTLGGEVSRGITGAQTATAQNQATWFKLKGEQADKARQLAGGFLNDPSFVKGDSEAMVKKFAEARKAMVEAGVPEAVAEAQIGPMISMAAHKPGDVRQALMNMTQSRMDPNSQVAAGAPQVSMIPTEQGIQPYNTNPNAVSAPTTLGPMGQPMAPPNQLATDSTGGTVVANPTTGHAAPLSTPAGSNPMSFPPGETRETQQALQDQRTSAQQQALQAGTLHDINRSIVSEVDRGLSTGKLGELTQKIASATGFHLATGEATDYNMLGKMLERSALTAAQGMGPHTNAGLEASVRANGSLDYTPQAIRKIATLNDALVSGQQAYHSGLERTIQQTGSPFAKRDFDEKWGKAFDPSVFKYMNAAEAGSAKDKMEALRDAGIPFNSNGQPDMKSKQAQTLKMKIMAIKKLELGEQ